MNDAERKAFAIRCETRLKYLTRAFETTGEYREFDLKDDWKTVMQVRSLMAEAISLETAALPSSSTGPAAPSAAAESSDESEDERGAGAVGGTGGRERQRQRERVAF